jgi:hypothetical protein
VSTRVWPRMNLRTWLWVIIALAVLLRLGAALYLGDDVTPEPGIYDQISYDGLARRVLAGYGFSFGQDWWPATAANAPTAHWSFLYTLYLTGVYALFGAHPLAARILQAVATGVLMPWLTFRLGRRVFGPAAGLAAAAVSAVYVYFFFFDASLMTEGFYMLGILWTLDLAGQIGGSHRRQYGRWALLGLAMGITALLRQSFLPAIVLLAAWLWWSTPGRRTQTVRGLALSCAVVVLLILPWTVRNYRVFHRVVLLNTNAGFAFFWANHPIHGSTQVGLLPPEISYYSLIPKELRGLDEAALASELMKRGVGFVADDPARWLLLSINRMREQFKFWPSSASGFVSNVSRVGSYGLFLPFMLAGVVMGVRESWKSCEIPSSNLQLLACWLRTEVALWLGFVVAYNFMHLVSWAGIRYRLPTDAVMVLFAGLALARLGGFLGRRVASWIPAQRG